MHTFARRLTVEPVEDRLAPSHAQFDGPPGRADWGEYRFADPAARGRAAAGAESRSNPAYPATREVPPEVRQAAAPTAVLIGGVVSEGEVPPPTAGEPPAAAELLTVPDPVRVAEAVIDRVVDLVFPDGAPLL